MVTAIKETNSQKGVQYFSKDDYYCSENERIWWGSGAAELGLTGDIKSEDFSHVLNGKNPQTGEGLTSHKKMKKRIAYTDITFSPSKSISALSRLDADIIKCHNDAVTVALKEMEKQYSLSVKKVNNKKVREVTGNLIVGRFLHSENREVEPQLHTHCVVANLTKTNDGKWRTFENRKIFDNQKLLDQIYTAELTRNLHLIGYQTRKCTRKDYTGKTIYGIEINGVSDATIRKYSTRNKQVVNELRKLEKEFQNKNGKAPTKSQKRKMIEKAKTHTRESKTSRNVERKREAVRRSIEADLELKNVFEKRGSKEPSYCDAGHLIRVVIKDFEESESTFTRKEILQEAFKRCLNTSLTLADLEFEFERNTHHIRDEIYTSFDMKMAAESSIKIVDTGISQSHIRVSEEVAEEYLKNKEVGGISFKSTQRNMIKKVACTSNQICLVQGDAGTGKTFAVEHLKKILESKGCTFRGLAPTGKAAKELQEVGLKSSTLDSFFKKKQRFKKDEVWIVDEASMIGNISMHKLLQMAEKTQAKVVLVGDTKQLQSVAAGKAFEELQRHSKVSVIHMDERIRQKTENAKKFVSLANKRDSVGAVKAMVEAECIVENSDVEILRKQAVDDYWKSSIEQSTVLLCQTNSSRVILNDEIRKRRVNAGKVVPGYEFGVFVSKNVGAVQQRDVSSYEKGMFLICNEKVGHIGSGVYVQVQHLHPEENALTVKYSTKNHTWKSKKIDLLKDADKFQTYTKEKREFGLGDEVVFLKNDTALTVTNGDTGLVEYIDRHGDMYVKIKGRKSKIVTEGGLKRDTAMVKVNLNNYQHIDHGYALTNYKAQGGTFDKAIVLTENSKRTNSNEWYVGLTRAKKEIVAYVNSMDDLKVYAGLSQRKQSVPHELNVAQQKIKTEITPEIQDEFTKRYSQKRQMNYWIRSCKQDENETFIIERKGLFEVWIKPDKGVKLRECISLEQAKVFARKAAKVKIETKAPEFTSSYNKELRGQCYHRSGGDSERDTYILRRRNNWFELHVKDDNGEFQCLDQDSRIDNLKKIAQNPDMVESLFKQKSHERDMPRGPSL